MDPFKGWAVLELMGHRRLAGYVQEMQIAGAGMLRIDVPAAEGDVTQFVSPSSLYALTPCTEATARTIAKDAAPAPAHEWEFPSLHKKALPPAPRDPSWDTDGHFTHDAAVDDDTDDETPRECLVRLVTEEGLDQVLRGLLEAHQRHEVDGPHTEQDRRAGILFLAERLVADTQVTGGGVLAIVTARASQLAQGYNAEHDDTVEPVGSLGRAAAWLLSEADVSYVGSPAWAHAYASKHRGDPPMLLAAAGALLAAEIDQRLRLAALPPEAPASEPQAADPVSARALGVNCGIQSSKLFVCTLPAGHDGEHIAHISSGREVYRWPQEPPATPDATPVTDEVIF